MKKRVSIALCALLFCVLLSPLLFNFFSPGSFTIAPMKNSVLSAEKQMDKKDAGQQTQFDKFEFPSYHTIFKIVSSYLPFEKDGN